MNEINREQFEAWLFAQADDREFKYTQGGWDDRVGCVMCNYLREQTNMKRFVVAVVDVTDFSVLGWRTVALPRWFIELMQHRDYVHLTAKSVKKAYTKLFGNPDTCLTSDFPDSPDAPLGECVGASLSGPSTLPIPEHSGASTDSDTGTMGAMAHSSPSTSPSPETVETQPQLA